MNAVENHMVLDLNGRLDSLYAEDVNKDKEDYELLKDSADLLLAGESVFGGDALPPATFEDVLQRTFEYTSSVKDAELSDFADCVKEVLELMPDSKLSRLVKYMAIKTAADYLDIDL